MESNKTVIIKKSFKSKPDSLRGIRPENALFHIGDPDMGELNHIEVEEFKKLYDACKPKSINNVGIIIIGTSGETDNNFKNIFYGK
jgi:hypothetical protein